MRVFVTGASGWIGSAVVPELLEAGHEVLGLARSDTAAETVAALGAEVHRGTLDDVESLRAGAVMADGVVHLGYHHDFSQMHDAAKLDRRAIETFGEVLSESGGPLVIASGVFGLTATGIGTEHDHADPAIHPRMANAQVALSLADQGVRSAVVRFAPTVHGPGDPGFVAALVELARRSGVAAYIGDGANRWPAVHRSTPRPSSGSRSSRHPPARCCTPSTSRVSPPARSPPRSGARSTSRPNRARPSTSGGSVRSSGSTRSSRTR